jgi:hypothetical protein
MSAPAAPRFVPCSGHVDPLKPGASERRFWPVVLPSRGVDELLAERAVKADPRRFNGEPITGFGSLA